MSRFELYVSLLQASVLADGVDQEVFDGVNKLLDHVHKTLKPDEAKAIEALAIVLRLKATKR